MIIFADAAALKVKEILELDPDYNSEMDTNLNLRVLISGGGCSGFKYGFSLDKKKEDGDLVVENQGVKLVVDPISAQYLEGAKIDYIESFESSHFEIRNPNAKRPWQYVLESISGMLWLATKMFKEDKFNEAWNFGPTSSSLTVRELANAILKEWDTNLMCEIQNNSDDMPESDILLLDSSKAEKNLGWKNILSIEETIFETVSWYKKNKNDMEEIKQFSLNQIENYVTKAKQRNTIWA